MVIREVNGKNPKWGADCFIAKNATIVGNVLMGDQCSIWFNAVLRGDVHFIKMGNKVNVQDGAVIHCTYQKSPTTIGNNVSIGHNAIVHGATIEDNVLIGMGAIVMDNTIIRTGAVVAAGAVVLANTEVEAGALYAGTPAKKVKMVDERLKQVVDKTPGHYIMYASWIED